MRSRAVTGSRSQKTCSNFTNLDPKKPPGILKGCSGSRSGGIHLPQGGGKERLAKLRGKGSLGRKVRQENKSGRHFTGRENSKNPQKKTSRRGGGKSKIIKKKNLRPVQENYECVKKEKGNSQTKRNLGKNPLGKPRGSLGSQKESTKKKALEEPGGISWVITLEKRVPAKN